jgi:hypothetical protein
MSASNGTVTVERKTFKQKKQHKSHKQKFEQPNKDSPSTPKLEQPNKDKNSPSSFPDIRPKPFPSQKHSESTIPVSVTAKPNVILGINVEKDESQREVLTRLETTIKKNNNKVKDFKGKVGELRDFNNKLADNYQLSLKMVVDVSDLLNHYVKIFEMLEGLMGNIDSTFEFNEEDFRYIRGMTEKSVQDIRFRMGNQVNDMIKVFGDNGYSRQALELKKLKESSTEISKNADILTKTTALNKSNTVLPSNIVLPSNNPGGPGSRPQTTTTQVHGPISFVQNSQNSTNSHDKKKGSRFGQWIKRLIFGKGKTGGGGGGGDSVNSTFEYGNFKVHSGGFITSGYTQNLAKNIKY